MNLAVLRKLLPYLAGAAIVLAAVSGLLWMGYRHGVTTTDNAWQSRWDKQAADLAIARADAEHLARQAERNSALAMAAIDKAYQQGKTDGKAQADRTIADLRNGNARLRERFTCPPAGNDMPDTAGTTGSSDAGEARGLQRDDAEFLIRYAERADEVVHQLQACQAIIQQDRQQ